MKIHFISFPVVDQDFVWYSSAVHDVSGSYQSDWIPLLEFAYNNNVHKSTGVTPHWLMYSFHPKTPLNFMGTNDLEEAVQRSLTRESTTFLEQLETHRGSARRAIAKAQDDQAKSYNSGRREIPPFKEGDRVLVNPHSLEWVESKGEGAKLKQRWIGPFEITQVINPNVYRLKMSNKYPGLPIFNFSHLRKYTPSPEEFSERPTLPETRTQVPEQAEYEVEKIVGHRCSRSLPSPGYSVWNPWNECWLRPQPISSSMDNMESMWNDDGMAME